jgi:hypothetical protein
VALPAAATTAGPILVINTVLTSGANLKVYPVNGGNDQINGEAEDAAFTMGPGAAAWFVPTSATQWYVADKAGVLTTKAEDNILDGVTSTAAELNFNDGPTAGVATASKTAVLGANKNLDEFHTAALYLGAGAGTLVASTAAQIDAAVAGTPLVYRTNVTAAQVNAGATAVVPAVAGKRFQVIHISMAAAGGNLSGPTTVEVVEETAGTVFLSHITADLTDGVWHNHITGTPVITGITNGGMTSADNKALIVTKSGGTDFATATGLDVIVMGYYTTT